LFVGGARPYADERGAYRRDRRALASVTDSRFMVTGFGSAFIGAIIMSLPSMM
jgi:hypothetical protein